MSRVCAILALALAAAMLCAAPEPVCAAGKNPPKKKTPSQKQKTPSGESRMSITRSRAQDDADSATIPPELSNLAEALRSALIPVSAAGDDPQSILGVDPVTLGETGDVIAAAVLRANRDCAFAAVRFKNVQTLERLMQGRELWVQMGPVALVPADVRESIWEDVETALAEQGATRVISPQAAQRITMQRWLELETQINIFMMVEGHPPDFAVAGWREMVRGRYISRMPVNQLSPIPVQSKIKVISIEGADGSRILPSDAAWVWNNSDQRIFAAGMTLAQYQAAHSAKQAAEDPAEQAALLRVRMTTAKFYNDWSKLIELLARKRQLHFPTVDEAQTIVRAMGKAGYNPFNGNNEVQSARWKRGNPPVTGNAGWNYDPVSGKFWCNARKADANKL